MIAIETAKVYRANNRRFFTKRAALRYLAMGRLSKRCECERPSNDGTYPGYDCKQHEYFAKVADRFVRRYRKVRFT